jgi:hypothetical protein
MFYFLLTNAKKCDIIHSQLNTNSIRASGGNLNRFDYQAPCESGWYRKNVSFFVHARALAGYGWTTERRASQNDTDGITVSFWIHGVFWCSDGSHETSLFHLLRKRLFLLSVKFGNQEQSSPFFLVLYTKKKVFSPTGLYFGTPLSKENEGIAILNNWMTVRTGYDCALLGDPVKSKILRGEEEQRAGRAFVPARKRWRHSLRRRERGDAAVKLRGRHTKMTFG